MIDGAVARGTGFAEKRRDRRDRPVHPHLEGDDGIRDYRRRGFLARAHSAEGTGSAAPTAGAGSGFVERPVASELDGGSQFRMALEDMLVRLEDTGILPDMEPRCYGYLVHYLGGALHRRRGSRSIDSALGPVGGGHRKAAELGFKDEGALMENRRIPGWRADE